jgi:hypothetical protein
MRLLILLCCVAGLAGCSSYSESFDCEPGKGMGCLSITQVNEATEPPESLPSSPSQTEHHGPLAAAIISQDTAHSIHRVPEEWLRIWITPFQDDQGNLHEASTIHTVVQPGYWHLSDLRGEHAR